MRKNWIIIILSVLVVFLLIDCFMLYKNGGTLFPQPTSTVTPSPTIEPSLEPTNTTLSPSDTPASSISDDIINKTLTAYEEYLNKFTADGNDGFWDGIELVSINGYPLLITTPTDVSSASIMRYDYQTGKIVDFGSLDKIVAASTTSDTSGYYPLSLEINKECTALRAVTQTKILYYTLNDQQQFLFGMEIPINNKAFNWDTNINALISLSDKSKVAKYGTFYDTPEQFTSALYNDGYFSQVKNFTKADLVNKL